MNDRLSAIRARKKAKDRTVQKNNRATSYRARQRAKGLCITCPSPLSERSVCYCDVHLEAANKAVRERGKERNANGLCAKCSNPLAETSKVFCSHHLKAANDRRLKSLKAKRLETEPDRPIVCGCCGQVARHNARTCPMKKAAAA